LEERFVPNVSFAPNPAWGAPTASTPDNPSVLKSVPIDLVFWGNYWQDSTGAGPSQKQAVIDQRR
jgi:hypothetical protein